MNRTGSPLFLAALVLAAALTWVPRAARAAGDDVWIDEKAASSAAPAASEPAIADPLWAWNFAWFHFNDRAYFWVIKPASQGYGYVTPKPARLGLDSFFSNLGFPKRLLNSAFQGHFGETGTEFCRFLINTTVGIGGFWSPADRVLYLPARQRDFDQTLGVWGVGMGFYMTWPFVGPSSGRGTLGLLMDSGTDGASALPGGSVVKTINSTSLGLNPYESLRQAAVDPYTAVRNAYVQSRVEAVKDKE
jgi:phospholipid-binding lipoprotein MlaA